MDFSKHINKAEEALRRRNYDFAVELYRQLVDLDPNLGAARGGLRRALWERAAQGRKAGGMLGKLKGAGPLAAAKGFLKAGKHDAAAKALETYLGSNPTDEEACLMLGQSLRMAGYTDAALAVFEFIAEVAPSRSDGWREAASVLAERGDVFGALERLEKALAADPRDREAQKARKDLAAEEALAARELRPDSHSRQQMADAAGALELERRGRLHASQEDLEGQLAALEARYAEQPGDVDLMCEMARVHERLRDPESALDLYQRALSYRKDDGELVAKVAEVRLKAKKKALAQAGKDGNQALADRLEGELAELERGVLERAVEADPGALGPRLELGKALLKAGELDPAIGHLQRVVPDPRLGDQARFFLALGFYRKGLLDLAKDSFQTCLPSDGRTDGRTLEILYHLGLIAEAQGDSEAARNLYMRIYAVDIAYRDVAQKIEQL
ncbi:MAG: tetratricopeptide repeat protein [Planctomycetota bacterium]